MDSQYLGAIEPREQWYFVFLHCKRLFPQTRYTLPLANTTSELSIVPAAGSALRKSTMAGKTVLLQIIPLWILDDYESNVKYEQNSTLCSPIPLRTLRQSSTSYIQVGIVSYHHCPFVLSSQCLTYL